MSPFTLALSRLWLLWVYWTRFISHRIDMNSCLARIRWFAHSTMCCCDCQRSHPAGAEYCASKLRSSSCCKRWDRIFSSSGLAGRSGLAGCFRGGVCFDNAGAVASGGGFSAFCGPGPRVDITNHNMPITITMPRRLPASEMNDSIALRRVVRAGNDVCA